MPNIMQSDSSVNLWKCFLLLVFTVLLSVANERFSKPDMSFVTDDYRQYYRDIEKKDSLTEEEFQKLTDRSNAFIEELNKKESVNKVVGQTVFVKLLIIPISALLFFFAPLVLKLRGRGSLLFATIHIVVIVSLLVNIFEAVLYLAAFLMGSRFQNRRANDGL